MLAGLILGLIGGAGLTALFFLEVARQKPPPKPRRIEHKPIIHMRGHEPAWFSNKYCQANMCVSTQVEGKKDMWHRKNACYVDQDGQYWCELHLPPNTRVAERTARQETEDGRCVTHDHKCPKPWEPY